MALWKFGSGAGTHALVVGVGEYPWLLGGSKPLFVNHEGMAQLTSAPQSAMAFATWLANDYHSTNYPLRTLELLLSAPAQPTFEPTPGAGPKVPKRALFNNFRTAVVDWHSRLGSSDRAIFYFCGHGLGAGLQHTLVLEDYGKHAPTIMSYAFDFSKFHVAMARAAALEQCYFIDACRVASGQLMQSLGTYGDPILTPSGSLPSPARKQPVFFATRPGGTAYGIPGSTSLFTEALFRTMKGAGAVRAPGNHWEIRPSALQGGLHHHLAELTRLHGADQSCSADAVTDYALHELPGVPSVPVVVNCGAGIDLTLVKVRVTGPPDDACDPPVPNPWSCALPPGTYKFATEPSGPSKSETVYPPVTPVDLP